MGWVAGHLVIPLSVPLCVLKYPTINRSSFPTYSCHDPVGWPCRLAVPVDGHQRLLQMVDEAMRYTQGKRVNAREASMTSVGVPSLSPARALPICVYVQNPHDSSPEMQALTGRRVVGHPLPSPPLIPPPTPSFLPLCLIRGEVCSSRGDDHRQRQAVPRRVPLRDARGHVVKGWGGRWRAKTIGALPPRGGL